jgi:hypothetical protein
LENKKKRHHHVWQRYLKPWTTGSSIRCLMGGRIFPTGTTKVAVERHFYRLHNLNDEDLALIKTQIIDQGHPYARSLHEDFARAITAPMRFVEQNRSRLRNLDKIDAHLDLYMSNVLENHHMHIETSFFPMLEKLGNGDLSFYADPNECIPSLRFLTTQYMRTKGVMVRSIDLVLANNGIDLTRIWNVISFMLATNVGAGLFAERERRTLALIHNHTDLEFITGDQPVINLHADRPHEVEKLSLYYPLGPQMALLLTEVDETPFYATDTLTPDQVAGLNKRMFASSHAQVFARTEEPLVKLLANAAELIE